MTVKQLTVFVENRTGYLSEITELLAQNGIDMKALSIADTKDFGILRLIVSDAGKALKILNEHGIIGKITEVVGVTVPNRPGGLSGVLASLASKGVNVEYLYAFLAGTTENAFVVLKATDNVAAEKVLRTSGFKPIEGLNGKQ